MKCASELAQHIIQTFRIGDSVVGHGVLQASASDY